MSKKPYRDKSAATEFNPKGYDYDGDKLVDADDDKLAVQDTSPRDGKVTNSEKEAYRKKQGTTTQVITEQDGQTTVETTQEVTQFGSPQPWLDKLTVEFLERHPGVAEALKKAREGNWSQAKFNTYIENNTAFGKARTDAQAAFDLAIAGSRSEDIEKQIDDKADEILADLQSAFGKDFSIDDAELQKYARSVLRDGITESDVRIWVAGKYKPNQPAADGAAPAPALQGESFQLDNGLRALAKSYGIPINDDFINQKVTEGLGQENPADWLAGQRGVFQQQAKVLYPSISDLLDTTDVETIMTPYRNVAFDLLGIPPAQQQLTDPMWNSALKGSENTPMSLDAWQATLKTDKRYGYTKTARGREEVSSMTQDLLRAFGVG